MKNLDRQNNAETNCTHLSRGTSACEISPEQKIKSLSFSSRPRSTNRQQTIWERVNSSSSDRLGATHNILVLNYTMKCVLACDYCCYSCSPTRSETMNFELARNLIKQAGELGVFGSIGFTGGEALIFHEEILDLAKIASRYGLKCSVVSAGQWANSNAAALEMLQPLRDAGLYLLSLSYDPSHERFVPRENILRAATTALKLGIKVVIAGSFYDPKTRLENILPEFNGNPNVELVNRVVLRVGRDHGIKKVPKDNYGFKQSVQDSCCYNRVYHDMTVFWDGAVYPCCSVYNRSTPGITLGNAWMQPLSDIWDLLEGSSLFRQMKLQGFGEIYRILKEYDNDIEKSLPDGSSAIGPCELCHQIFSDKELTERIRGVYNRVDEAAAEKLINQLKKAVPNPVFEKIISQFAQT